MTWKESHFHPAPLAACIADASLRWPGCTMSLRWPGCTMSRSGNQTGNIIIFDYDGNYVGLIELNDPPKLTAFDEPDDEPK